MGLSSIFTETTRLSHTHSETPSKILHPKQRLHHTPPSNPGVASLGRQTVDLCCLELRRRSQEITPPRAPGRSGVREKDLDWVLETWT